MKIKKILSIILLLITIIIIIFLMIISKLKITEITVDGESNFYNDEEIIDKIIGDERRSFLIFLKKNRKIKIPHIESYDIEFETKEKISIKVVEKQPVGYIKKDIQKIVIDNDGSLVSVFDNLIYDLPEVRGFNIVVFDNNNIVYENFENMQKILDILSYNAKENLKIDTIEFDEQKGIRLYKNATITELGTTNLESKMEKYKSILPHIQDMSGTLDLSNVENFDLSEEYIFKKN